LLGVKSTPFICTLRSINFSLEFHFVTGYHLLIILVSCYSSTESICIALGLDEDEYSQFGDWTALREKFTNTFATKTQSEWAVVFAGKDACVTPVVELEDAHKQSYNRHVCDNCIQS